jgi:hypothetical protein
LVSSVGVVIESSPRQVPGYRGRREEEPEEQFGAGVRSGQLADQGGRRRHRVRAPGVATGGDQGTEQPRILLGQGEADLAAHRPADQDRLDQPERSDQSARIVRHQRHRDRLREVVAGVTDAAVVEDRHPEVPRQRPQQIWHPEAHRRRVPLDHDQIGPVPELPVADRDPVDRQRVDRPLEGAGARQIRARYEGWRRLSDDVGRGGRPRGRDGKRHRDGDEGDETNAPNDHPAAKSTRSFRRQRRQSARPR